MANLHACSFVTATLLLSFAFPSSLHASKLPSSRKLSFELRLQWPPLNLHNATSLQQPLTPYLFSNQPLFHFDESSHAHAIVGGAHGLFLADPAASMELCYVLFTATLKNDRRGHINEEAENEEEEEGSLVLMGSLRSGAISIVGGTRGFAFASGVAKVSMAPAGTTEQRIIFLDVELQSEEEDPNGMAFI